MVDIQNLSKCYKVGNEDLWAIKNVSMHIDKGEIFGIIGMSGAGKSTLIRCLNRLEEPTEGRIIIDGTDITSLKKKELRTQRKNIGMIFQHFNLLMQKTTYENIALPLELTGTGKREIEARVNALLKYVGLEDKRNVYPSQLSGGQKQRVAIARALANNPKILLSDEATSALDPQTTKSILDLLKRIRDELGLTIIMITHQIEVVKDICDRVAIMESGEIVEINTVEELFKRPRSKTARAFINSLKSDIQEEFIKPAELKGHIVRLSFWGDIVKKPVVSHMVKRFDIDVNILSGNISQLMSTSAGHLIVELTGPGEEIRAALDYLKAHEVDVEVM